MAEKPPRSRSERRAAERAARKLTEARERLARLEPGGTPERPLDVVSAAVVEVRALETHCARCDGALRLDEHQAIVVAGQPLRVANMRCVRCHSKRDVYFRLTPVLAN